MTLTRPIRIVVTMTAFLVVAAPLATGDHPSRDHVVSAVPSGPDGQDWGWE